MAGLKPLCVRDRGADTLVSQAREWEASGEYERAVECYAKVNSKVTQDVNVLLKCWVKVSATRRRHRVDVNKRDSTKGKLH